MAIKIYINGGAININDGVSALKIINPAQFDWKPNGLTYEVRDKIDNQSYNLGILANIQNESGVTYTSSADLIAALNSFVNKTPGINPNNIPASYTMQASNAVVKGINKGQLNKLRIRPQIINEQVESSRVVQGVVDATTIVGQIFKASQDNINGVFLTLESADGVSLDNFESYADSAALQTVWITGGSNDAELEAVIVAPGGSTKSMELPLDILADSWVDTIAPTDYTNYVGEFDFYQDTPFGLTGAIVSVFIGDGANTKSFPITFDEINLWHRIHVNENAMIEDGGITDVTAITQIGFKVVGKKAGQKAYIDNLVATPPPGKIGLKLWDMGTDIPVTAVNSIDDGTQYSELGDRGINGGSVTAEIELPLIGGKRLYSIKNFVAGTALEIPGNTLLTAGNYYILSLNYVDTDVSVYGVDPSYTIQYYNNGFAFTAPDEATAITAIGTFNDIMFGIFSTQDVFLNTMVKAFDSDPGNLARESILVEDKNMQITGIIENDTLAQQTLTAEFKDRTFPMPKGSKFEVYYNDDYTDSVSVATILIGYIYEPPIING